jgi:hypothetical protein
MKGQIDGYVRTLENRAHAALFHHHSREDGDATSYGEFLAYVRVISDFTGEHRLEVLQRIADEAKVPA